MRLRELPEDFSVEEEPLYAPSGEGTHTFVQVEKRLRTSEEVARDLARAAGVRPRDVGYAGRKDRRALTTQWFSVPGLDPERARGLALPGARILAAARHPHKLRTGQLRGNRFRIRVRDVDDGACARAEAGLARLLRTGMPNRFGPQRFGRDGRNAEQARAVLRAGGSGPPARDRRALRFAFSALQAEVFERVLAGRSAPLDTVESGDVAVVHESGGLFVVDAPEREAPRAAAFEISATGPIFGTRVLAPAGDVARREGAARRACGVPETWRPPRGVRLRGARRALRVRPRDAELARDGADLLLSFALPPGSYATVLVEELLGPLDAPPPTR